MKKVTEIASPAVSGRNRSQSTEGQLFQGTRPAARRADRATRPKIAGVRAETGMAAYWSVPARAWMAAAAHRRRKIENWSRSRIAVGFDSPPACSSSPTARKVAPQAKVARISPLASRLSNEVAAANRASGGEGLRSTVSRTETGSSRKRPKAKETASSLTASRTPAPSSPMVRSRGVRSGRIPKGRSQITIIATNAAQAKQAASPRPARAPARPASEDSTAPPASRATGRRRAAAGTELGYRGGVRRPSRAGRSPPSGRLPWPPPSPRSRPGHDRERTGWPASRRPRRARHGVV